MIQFFDSNIYLITFVVVIGVFLLLIQANKKTLIIKHSVIVGLFLAAIQFLNWFIYVIDSLQKGLWNYVLLQDLCPTAAFLSIIVFVINKEKVYKAFMPWFLIGATFTILFGHAPIISDSYALFTYFRHVVLLIQGILSYLLISKYQKKELYLVLLFPTILIIWNLLVGLTPWQVTKNIRWAVFSTALLEPSISYKVLSMGQSVEVITDWVILDRLGNMPYPLPTLIFYVVSLVLAYGLVVHKNFANFYLQKITNLKLKIFRRKKVIK